MMAPHEEAMISTGSGFSQLFSCISPVYVEAQVVANLGEGIAPLSPSSSLPAQGSWTLSGLQCAAHGLGFSQHRNLYCSPLSTRYLWGQSGGYSRSVSAAKKAKRSFLFSSPFSSPPLQSWVLLRWPWLCRGSLLQLVALPNSWAHHFIVFCPLSLSATVLCGHVGLFEALYSSSPELQGCPLLLLMKFQSSGHQREAFLKQNKFLNETWKEMLELFQDCILASSTVCDG